MLRDADVWRLYEPGYGTYDTLSSWWGLCIEGLWWIVYLLNEYSISLIGSNSRCSNGLAHHV